MKMDRFIREKYGLQGNPFLDTIARELWLQTWVDREAELKEWTKHITASASPRKNTIIFIIGDYGRGKTLSLLKVMDVAKRHPSILPVYLNFKGEQKPKAPGLDFILRIFKSVDFAKIKGDASQRQVKKTIESVPDDLDEVKAVLTKIYSGDVEEKKLALYFFKGEIKPTKTDLKKLGVIRKLDDIDTAKEYLAGLLAFARGCGFSTLLLAVDEFEYLFSLVTKPQRSIYLALLRGLYDFPVGMTGNVGDTARMTFFVAVSEDGWRRMKDMKEEERSTGGPIQPLLRRVDGETVLRPFDKNETRELVEKRLKFDRIQGKYRSQPLIPFSQDFVEYIHGLTNGEPWAIIGKCALVLDVGLEKGVVRLDKPFAKNALRERGEL